MKPLSLAAALVAAALIAYPAAAAGPARSLSVTGDDKNVSKDGFSTFSDAGLL